MTRVAGIADVHLGNHQVFGGPVQRGINTRAQQVLDALDAALAADNCPDLVVCGDLFDVVRPLPQHIAAVQQRLGQYPGAVHVVVGNHDQVSSQPGDHACSPLAPVARVYDTPTAAGGVVAVPFINAPVATYLPQALERVGRQHTQGALLAIHAGIEDRRTPKFLRGAHDSIPATQLFTIMEEWGIQACFAGNWHDQRYWRSGTMEIAQIGATCPTGFDNPGPEGYGGFAIWHPFKDPGERIELRQLPGPRFLKGRSVEAVTAQFGKAPDGCVFYASVVASLEDFDAVCAELERLKQDGVLAGWKAELDGKQVQAMVADAVADAGEQSTQRESLHAYVRKMPLDTGLARDRVLAICLDALAS